LWSGRTVWSKVSQIYKYSVVDPDPHQIL
jgi:hypothetical protein